MEAVGKRNVYICQECRNSIVTENTIELVTPFMIGCRADPECDGMMHSGFYPDEIQGDLWRRLKPTTHLWVEYTMEDVKQFRAEGDDQMVEWTTGCHGKLVEA